MTDAEIRDAALTELKQTTRGLSGYSPPATSHWGKALALLAQVSFYVSERDAAVLELRLTTVGYNYYKGALPPAGSHWGKALAYLKEVGVPVSVTLSTSGGVSNLRGTVTLTASPTASGQVASVKFFVDDVLLSTDTSAPYTASWNTTTVADGSHQLKAQAFYTKNQMAEAKLTVTVFNNVAPPPPPPVQGVPVNVNVPAVSGTATEGQVLTISENTSDWTNAPTSYTHAWDRCDAGGASCVDIPSATGKSYTITSTDVGSTIRCWTTAFNSYGASAPIISAATAVVSALTPAVPVNTAVPMISGSATQGSTLSVSDGGWSHSPTSYTHCWDRCDANGANCADIAGQDCNSYNNSYVVTSTDVGSTIRAYTTAKNASGSSTPILSAATAVVTAPPAPPPSGIVLFDGGFETGNISQWDILQAASPARAVVSTGLDGVTPRRGNYLCRLEVRSGDAIYGPGTNACQVIRADNISGHYSVLGDDLYEGWSLYLPSNFQPNPPPNGLANTFFEWHGDTSAVQASVTVVLDTVIGSHYGITNSTPGFALELHTQAGFNPQMFRFADGIYGQWVDFVVHTKWATDGTGIVEGWMNGVKKFSYVGQTWYSGGQISRVKPQLGYYRAEQSWTSFVYVDAFKIGTTYAAVAP